eukprot:GHVU01039211.1.p1 GENE.GHVU01039211.1~~GHVU01039211.1.p1  ORF type:complete len:153 (+),score=16.23 GHVU01039211.1:744-1202(+)
MYILLARSHVCHRRIRRTGGRQVDRKGRRGYPVEPPKARDERGERDARTDGWTGDLTQPTGDLWCTCRTKRAFIQPIGPCESRVLAHPHHSSSTVYNKQYKVDSSGGGEPEEESIRIITNKNDARAHENQSPDTGVEAVLLVGLSLSVEVSE